MTSHRGPRSVRRASIPVLEPVHAGKRTDRPVCEPALTVSPLIATFHARRHASRCRRRCGDLSAPSETTAPRRLSSIRRCDADQDPSSSSSSFPLLSFQPPFSPHNLLPNAETRFVTTPPEMLRATYAQRYASYFTTRIVLQRVINSIRTNTRFVSRLH